MGMLKGHLLACDVHDDHHTLTYLAFPIAPLAVKNSNAHEHH